MGRSWVQSRASRARGSRVAPRIVRIYTLRGFESPRLDHRALGQDRTVLRGVRERPDHRVCRTQASGRPWAEESLLPSDPRARPRLQDRVHPRLPEPAGASHADPTRAPQGRTATRPRPVRPLRPTGPTGSARLRTPNRRGELPASHPRSYHLLADSGDRSCFERGGLGWPDDLNFELLSHISPIGWDNVLLYGEYQLNRSLVRSERLSV